MHNNGEAESRIRRVDRRSLLKIGAVGIGVTAVVGGGLIGGFYTAKKRYSRETPDCSGNTEIHLPPFDINSFIQKSDWILIDALMKSDVKSPHYLKAKISAINQDKGKEFTLDESRWQNEIDFIHKLIGNKNWSSLIPQAAYTVMAFPERANQIYDMIDEHRDDMQGSINNSDNFGGHPWDIPDRGFEFKNILYPHIDTPITDTKVWEMLNENLNHDYDIYKSYGMTDSISSSLSTLRHFAPDRLPPYFFDAGFRTTIRFRAVERLEFDRHSFKDDPPLAHMIGFIDDAYDSRLLEADKVEMTQQGLVLS